MSSSRRGWPGLRWCALALALLGCGAQAADELRFAVGESWAMPLIQLRQRQPEGGILFDLMQRIAAHAGARPRFVSLPSMRVGLALGDGSVDLHCHLNPKWMPEAVAPARWSVALLRMEDVLIAPPGDARAEVDLTQQRQTHVATVLGYTYPSLEPAFAAGRLLRHDVGSQEQVLAMVSRGRLDLGVGNHLAVDWFNKSRPAPQRVHVMQAIDPVSTHCLLAERPQLPPQRILAAVQRLVDSGEIATILQRYR